MRRIFVVCTNPENGQYIAFDAANPLSQVTGYSKEGAIATFVCEYMTDVVEIFEQTPERSAAQVMPQLTAKERGL